MSEQNDDDTDPAVRLQRLARSLRNSLSFAAPEIWTLHIMESLGAAFDLGRASAERPPTAKPVGFLSDAADFLAAAGEDDIERARRGA